MVSGSDWSAASCQMRTPCDTGCPRHSATSTAGRHRGSTSRGVKTWTRLCCPNSPARTNARSASIQLVPLSLCAAPRLPCPLLLTLWSCERQTCTATRGTPQKCCFCNACPALYSSNRLMTPPWAFLATRGILILQTQSRAPCVHDPGLRWWRNRRTWAPWLPPPTIRKRGLVGFRSGRQSLPAWPEPGRPHQQRESSDALRTRERGCRPRSLVLRLFLVPGG